MSNSAFRRNSVNRLSCGLAALALILSTAAASAETADTVLFNGKILTVDKEFSVREALAIAHGRVLATGTSSAMKQFADDKTRLIDLGGRTVILGLTDGHIHGIRAALTFGTEVNWIGVPSLREALEKIRAVARTQKPGSWIVVAGGWTEEQFAEKRRPSPQEVAEAAPDNPVYIQHLYDWLLLTPKAMEALNIRNDADVTPGGKLELDGDKPTGVVIGNGNTLGKIFDHLPKPTLDQQVDGSRKFFREMNSLGITGIVDGGGVSMYPANYQAVFQLWHDKQLTVRVAYHLCAPKPGSELADLQNLTQLLPQGFGDDMLHFNGPGEILIWADWTDGDITPDGKAKLAELLRWAASKGYTIQLHWNPDRTVHDLLDIVEDISRDYPVRDLRWTVLPLQRLGRQPEANASTGADLGCAGRPLFRRRTLAEGGRRGSGEADAADRNRAEARPDGCRRDRRAPGVVLQSLRFAAMVSRRHHHRRCADAPRYGSPEPAPGAGNVHPQFGVHGERRRQARHARAGQVRRPRRAVVRLSDRAGEGDRQD
jgi:Amidohydrolase family